MTEPQQSQGIADSSRCSTVSLIDFQMTVANLSVAEYALREEPYERLPYLAGTMLVAQQQMECLRQEAMAMRVERDRYKRMANEGITDDDIADTMPDFTIHNP